MGYHWNSTGRARGTTVRRRWVAASGLVLVVSVAAPAATAAAGSSGSTVPTVTNLQPRFDTGLRATPAPAAAAVAAAAPGSLATFYAHVTDQGTTYGYHMVGQDPSVPSASPATTVTTVLVPVVVEFPNGDTFDPRAVDSCDAGATALTRVQRSPIFTSRTWTFGSTTVGTGQYIDAFQRANFWAYTNPAGVNPGYHVTLDLQSHRAVTIHVPAADAAEAPTACGNGKLGLVEINWLDSYLQTTVLPGLAATGFGPSTFPVFLLHNVGEYVGTIANCCVLGYHNAYHPTVGTPFQSYAVSMYDNSGAFPSAYEDTATLSHEVGEWVNDPYTYNETRPWGPIGQVTACQASLEVGDPLSGTGFEVRSNGFSYHLQELAFFSWFYRQTPSLGVNGWYSNRGTFTGVMGTCDVK